MRDRPNRLRRVASLVVLVVAGAASVATSPSSTMVTIRPVSGAFVIDADHPVALARAVVRLDAVATSSSSYPSISLSVNDVRSTVGGAEIPDNADSVRFIVSSTVPGVLASDVPSGSEPGASSPIPSAWQVDLGRGPSVSLPLDCPTGIGPCERAFWLIAQLADEGVGALEVSWEVRGWLSYPGNAYPSGAGVSVDIDDAILVSGPTTQLVASTELEALPLGPERPAAARVVEVSIGAAAIPKDGNPIATMSIDRFFARGSGGDSNRPPIIRVFELDEAGKDISRGPLLEYGQQELDPFMTCPPGADCTRRFLVTFAWAGEADEPESHDWRVTVRRTDLVRAWSAPAELSASVVRRFDVDPEVVPSTAHFEGDALGVVRDAPPLIDLSLATRTTSDDPLAAVLAVPAVMTYRASIINAGPEATPGYVASSVTFPGDQGMTTKPISKIFAVGGATIVANPLGGCWISAPCGDLALEAERGIGRDGAELPAVDIHWSVDLAVYSYVDVPITLTATKRG